MSFDCGCSLDVELKSDGRRETKLGGTLVMKVSECGTLCKCDDDGAVGMLNEETHHVGFCV